MQPLHETRPRELEEHTIDLDRIPNNIYDLVDRVERSVNHVDDKEIDMEDGSDCMSLTYASTEYDGDPIDFFKEIIFDLIPDVVKTDSERIRERYDNERNPFTG